MLVVSVPAQPALEGAPLLVTAAPRAFVGSEEAELTRLRPTLRAVAARVLSLPGQHSDVEDCVAEALRRVFEGRARLRDGEPIGPWAVGIVRHVALDLLRARRREATRRGDEAAEAEVPDSAPGPDLLIEQRRELASVRSALDALPEGQRRAIVAFHVEGASYQAIARELNVAMGTVATWIARGRRALVASVRPSPEDEGRGEEAKR